MAISASFNRPKLATVVSQSVNITGAIAEGSNEFIVDINATYTDDQSNSKTKTLFRVKLPFVINGATIKLTDDKYVFPGNATDYSSGGNTPALSLATKGNTVDLNAFLSLGGKAQTNS